MQYLPAHRTKLSDVYPFFLVSAVKFTVKIHISIIFINITIGFDFKSFMFKKKEIFKNAFMK